MPRLGVRWGYIRSGIPFQHLNHTEKGWSRLRYKYYQLYKDFRDHDGFDIDIDRYMDNLIDQWVRRPDLRYWKRKYEWGRNHYNTNFYFD